MKFIVALALFLPLCAALDVTARRYVLAENASKFYTELDNRHENVTLSPRRALSSCAQNPARATSLSHCCGTSNTLASRGAPAQLQARAAHSSA